MPQVKIEGLKNLEKTLLNLGTKTAGKVLREMLKEIAQPMFNDMKNNVAVNKGTLRDSGRITSSVGRSKRSKFSARARIIFGGKSTKKRKSAGHLLTEEFGNSKRAARPFMRPAFDKNVNQALSTFKSKLREKILKAAKKNGN